MDNFEKSLMRERRELKEQIDFLRNALWKAIGDDAEIIHGPDCDCPEDSNLVPDETPEPITVRLEETCQKTALDPLVAEILFS